MRSSVCFGVLGVLVGCGGSSGDGSLRTTKNVTSLIAGASETVGVEALDADGEAQSFTATAKGKGCVTLTDTATGFTVTAGTKLCQEEITVTSPKLSKAVTVNVYDPQSLDLGGGLLIRYVNQYTSRWDDAGSGGDQDMTFWHPVAPAGWYALGSYLEASYRDVNAAGDLPMIVVQDSQNAGLLAAPTSYTLIYNDQGSGASRDGSVWLPVCPTGFVALGVVTNSGYSSPSADDVRCVKSSYTAAARVGGRTYTDVGTGASMYLGAFNIEYPTLTTAPDNRTPLLAGTNAACGWDASSCSEAVFHLLLVPLELVVNSDNDAEPKLTSKTPLDTSRARIFSSMRVPFTTVPSVNANTGMRGWNVANSPFYTLQRVEAYVPIDVIDNSQGTTEAEYTYHIETGYSQTESSRFTESVGLEVTVGGEVGFLGTGGSWEVKVSTQFEWESSSSSTYGETISRDYSFKIPAGAYAEIVQVQTYFTALNALGTPVSTFGLKSNIIKYLQL